MYKCLHNVMQYMCPNELHNMTSTPYEHMYVYCMWHSYVLCWEDEAVAFHLQCNATCQYIYI